MPDFKTILALDTALNNCSAAVYDSGETTSETKEMIQGHAEHLMPMVARVLDRAGVAYDRLEAIATTVGPGAFTGLRIGLSAARALALALGIPVYGITTTQLLALQAVKENAAPVAVILETKRQDFYVQTFDKEGKALSAAACVAADAIKTDGFVLVGDGVERLTGKKAVLAVPGAGFMAGLLAQRPEFFMEGAEPVYLRGADVTASKQQNRVLAVSTDIR